MTSYQDITRQIGDQWVAAFKRAEDAVSEYAENVQKVKGALDLPALPTPEPLAELSQSLTEKLPKASEIVAANFDLVNRLLTAQRDLALRLLEQSDKAPKAEAAKRSSAPKATTANS